jgi:hypothetical protein
VSPMRLWDLLGQSANNDYQTDELIRP